MQITILLSLKPPPNPLIFLISLVFMSKKNQEKWKGGGEEASEGKQEIIPKHLHSLTLSPTPLPLFTPPAPIAVAVGLLFYSN